MTVRPVSSRIDRTRAPRLRGPSAAARRGALFASRVRCHTLFVAFTGMTTMIKYKTVVRHRAAGVMHHAGWSGDVDFPADASESDMLALAGRDGWDLTSVVDDGADRTFYFKRSTDAGGVAW